MPRSTPSEKAAPETGLARTVARHVKRLDEQCRRLEHEIQLYQALGDFEAAGFSVERLLSRFLVRAMRFFDASAGTLSCRDGESGDLVFKVVRGAARQELQDLRVEAHQGITGRVARSGKPVLARDASQQGRGKSRLSRALRYRTGDIMAVPIRTSSGKLSGVIELFRNRNRKGFGKKDLDHLTAVSGSIGNLLENTFLWSRSERRNRHLKLLHEVSRLVSSSLDPAEVRRRAIRSAVELVKGEAGSLLLYDRDSEEIFFQEAVGGKAGEVKRIRLRKGEGIAGWVVRHGKPVVVPDCQKDYRWSNRSDRVFGFCARDMVCVPLKIRGKVVGAIQAVNKKNGGFDREDVELLVMLAAQTAVALENARLFDALQRAFYETSQALADAIEVRDAYTGGHTRRVTGYSLAAGMRLGLKPDELERLRVAAILHDIGKLGVDDRVLRKPGQLDRLEIEQMQKHPALGADILDHVHYLSDILPGIRSHHERNDGLGYPDGLRGERIPLMARIIAVADTYDAMTSDRPYRRGINKSLAIREIARCSGTQFDARVVHAFLRAYADGEITGTPERLPRNAPREN